MLATAEQPSATLIGKDTPKSARKRAVQASVAAVIVNEKGRLRFGKRRGSKAKGDGQTSVPGGEINFGESIQQAVEREVLEETGLIVRAMPLSQVQPELF